MNIKSIRWILLIAIAFFAISLWARWQNTQVPTSYHAHKTVHVIQPENHIPPEMLNNTTLTKNSHEASHLTTSNIQPILINTDLLTLKIMPKNGNIVGADLKKYATTLKNKTPFPLLWEHQKEKYVAESGLISNDLPDNLIFHATKNDYTLQPGKNKLIVNLVAQTKALTIHKIYTFWRNKYLIGVKYKITNNSNALWQGRFYGQFVRTQTAKSEHGSWFSHLANHDMAFNGAAFSNPEHHYQKLSYKDMSEQDYNQLAQGGWAAMVQHYFISAWIPNQHQQSQFYSREFKKGTFGVGVAVPELSIKPGQTMETGANLYVGPAIAKRLNAAAPYLSLTIDYGFLWFISDAVFWLMSLIHGFIGNWGWSIVLVTILIKLIFYPLSAKSYRSMARMRALQPKIAALKERYGDEKQKMSKAMMELYKSEKVNPLGGCLPMIIQIPVFFALYWVLLESVELRHAPFIFWIHDLSARDPYFILPILMGLSMFLQQKMMPSPPDPTQAKVMMFLPIMFTLLFLTFPSGLVLYWLVNNLISISQQWWATRHYMHEMKAKKKRRGQTKK